MTFKREISWDGVAVIVIAVGVIITLANMKFQVDSHTQKINVLEEAINKLSATDTILQEDGMRINDFEQRIRFLEKQTELNSIKQVDAK